MSPDTAQATILLCRPRHFHNTLFDIFYKDDRTSETPTPKCVVSPLTVPYDSHDNIDDNRYRRGYWCLYDVVSVNTPP